MRGVVRDDLLGMITLIIRGSCDLSKQSDVYQNISRSIKALVNDVLPQSARKIMYLSC